MDNQITWLFVLWLFSFISLRDVFLESLIFVSGFVLFRISWIMLKPCVSSVFYGEFDPGSGRTLAACLTHASRTVRPLRGYTSGERVSNTWVTCPVLRDKPGKLGLIPDMTFPCMGVGGKLLRYRMGPRPISLLVG